MAKLYWRIKRLSKWTWIAATSENTRCDNDDCSLPEYYHPAQRHIDSLKEDIVEKPEVDRRAVEEEVCFACETVGEEHCNVHRQYE